jgi:hypothetical protein
MASISLTYTGTPADLTNIVTNAAYALGYQDTINGQANPQSKQEFVRIAIAGYVHGLAAQYLQNLATTAAVQQLPDPGVIT